MLNVLAGKFNNRRTKMKKNDTLKTPEWVYSELGTIDLDPCAGNDTNIATTNWALERGEDGLTQDWFGFVYCNPPFSQKETWAEKMIAHGNGILLLPERGSAPWFTPIASASKYYWVMGKKINFDGGSSSNNLGSILFPFGEEAVERILTSNLPGHLSQVTHFRSRNCKQLNTVTSGEPK
jgi:hypothetical protein